MMRDAGDVECGDTCLRKRLVNLHTCDMDVILCLYEVFLGFACLMEGL